MKKKDTAAEVSGDECGHNSESSKVLQINKNIFIFGEINMDSTGNFMAAFAEADSTPGLITVHICSQGGWVEGGMAMYDTIKGSNNKVLTVARGTVCSSAILPFVAGDMRLTQKSTRFLLHDMSIGIGEMPLRMVKNISSETSKLYDMYCKYVSDSTGQLPSTIDDLCKNETYLSSEDVLRWNIANKLIPYNEEKFDLDAYRASNVTAKKSAKPVRKTKKVKNVRKR